MIKLFIKQQLTPFVDTFKVTDEEKQIKYKVKSKLISPIRHKRYVKDASGQTLFTVNQKLFDFMPEYYFELPNGEVTARIRKKMALNASFDVLENENNYSVEKGLIGFTYTLKKDGQTIGTITKKAIEFLGDGFTLELNDGEDEAFFIGMTIVIDNMYHKGK